MSRPRKPPEKLQDRRASRTAPRLVELGDERDQRRRAELSARIPPKLLALTTQHWHAYWRSDIAAIAKEEDLPALQQLFMLRDERERLWRSYKRERLVVGSRGQVVVNPVLGSIRALGPEITALENCFGLNPRARTRLGLSFVKAARTLADVNREALSRAESDADPRDAYPNPTPPNPKGEPG